MILNLFVFAFFRKESFHFPNSQQMLFQLYAISIQRIQFNFLFWNVAVTITNTRKFNYFFICLFKRLLYNFSTFHPQLRDRLQVKCFLTAIRNLHICFKLLEISRKEQKRWFCFHFNRQVFLLTDQLYFSYFLSCDVLRPSFCLWPFWTAALSLSGLVSLVSIPLKI